MAWFAVGGAGCSGRLKLIGGADLPEPTIERYVDINGVLWSSWNLGATAPEQPGDCFAWGETSTKTTWGNWQTYFDFDSFWLYDSSVAQMKKYPGNGYTGLYTLEEVDDAATANWGSEWRMPTTQELASLWDVTACKWTYMTYKDQPGYKVESRTSGNWIFLPVSGYWQANGSWTDTKSIYWSSSLETTDGFHRSAYMLEVNSNNGGHNYSYLERLCGAFIRPVRK